MLRFAQRKLGMKYFTKEVVNTFSDVESAEEAEAMIVDADIVRRLNNFNLALGGRQVSLKPSLAHPLKIRVLQWSRVLKKSDWDGVPVWLYRKRIAEHNKVVEAAMYKSLANRQNR